MHKEKFLTNERIALLGTDLSQDITYKLRIPKTQFFHRKPNFLKPKIMHEPHVAVAIVVAALMISVLNLY